MDFQKFRQGGRRERIFKFVIEEINSGEIYDIGSIPTHIGLVNGCMSLFVSTSIQGDVKTSRTRFFKIPEGMQYVQFPEYKCLKGNHFYGKIIWG